MSGNIGIEGQIGWVWVVWVRMVVVLKPDSYVEQMMNLMPNHNA